MNGLEILEKAIEKSKLFELDFIVIQGNDLKKVEKDLKLIPELEAKAKKLDELERVSNTMVNSLEPPFKNAVLEMRKLANKEKVLNILKEKKVDIEWIQRHIIDEDVCVTQTELCEYWGAHPTSDLTLEEIQLIVNWLKEE